MFLNGRGKYSKLLVTAAILVCMLTACSFGRGKESPTQNNQQTQAVSQAQNSGSQTSGSVLPEDSILNFQNDKGFARLQSDMKNGDIPIECNVLYDEDGARPDVTVTDQETIREIYDQLADITVGDKSSEKVTGSYHHITFRLRNDTYVTFNFEGEKLFCWGVDNYIVSGGNNLWNSVRRLQMAEMNSQDQAKQTAGNTAQTEQASTSKTSSSSAKNSDKDSAKEKETEKTGLKGKRAPESQDGVETASDQDGSTSVTGDKAKSENGLAGEAAKTTKNDASKGIEAEKDSAGKSQKTADTDKKQSADASKDAQKPAQTTPSDKAAEAPADPAGTSDDAGKDSGTVLPDAGTADTGNTAEAAEGTDTGNTAEPAAGADTSAEAKTEPAADPSDSSTAGTAATAQAAEETADPGLDPAMAEAYTDIVRAYAKVFSIDKDKFMEAYSEGLYSKEAPNPDLASDFDERINYDLYLDLYTGTLEGDAAYGLHDYNNDGIQELVIAVVDGDYKTLRAMYTFDGKKAVSLFTGSITPAYRVDVFSLPDEEFLVHSSGGAASGGDTICRIKEDASGMKIIAEYEYDATKTGNLDHISKTGEVLTEEEFYDKYSETSNPADGLSFEKVSEDAEVSLKQTEE